METKLNHSIPGIPNRSPQDIERFITLITKAVDWAHQHKDAPNCFPDDETGDVIITSFLLSNIQSWGKRFTDSQKTAARFYRDWNTYRTTIAAGVSTQEVEKQCSELFPNLDRAKYFHHTIVTPTPQKITPRAAPTPKKKQLHKRGELWKLDPKWENLWPSSRKVFTEMLRRYQFSKRQDAFPWCQAGIKSLHKFTGVSQRRIQDSLKQLEQFKLIKRIVKGNEFQGCSKYLVFIVPEMSGAFSRKSLHTKKDPPSKKRIVRMR